MNALTSLMVQAVLLDGAAGLAAFRSWRAEAVLDHLPPEQYVLVPMLYTRLVELQVEDGWLPRLKGLYRRSWYVNQLALDALKDLLEALKAAQIAGEVTGGAYLAQVCYPEPALRPIRAIEVVVPQAQFDGAVVCALQNGWQPLRSSRGAALVERFLPRADRWFSASANLALQLRRQRLNGAPCAPLTAEEHLLNTCCDLYRIGAPALVDAAMLIRTGLVKWGLLLGQAQGMEIPLLYVLEFLAECGAVAVPMECLYELRQKRPGPGAAYFHTLGLVLPAQRSVFSRTLLALRDYWDS